VAYEPETLNRFGAKIVGKKKRGIRAKIKQEDRGKGHSHVKIESTAETPSEDRREEYRSNQNLASERSK